MDIYIDKANFKSLMLSKQENRYDDALRVIKKQLNVFFNFPKSELIGDESLMMCFQTLAEEVGENNKFEFDFSFPEKPIKSNSSNNFTSIQLSSVFLLDDPDAEKLKNSGTLLVGLLGEEIQTISELFLYNTDYDFERKWRIGDVDFTKWIDLTPFSLPLTDIIIVDPYILKNKDTATDTAEQNLIQYIGVLASKSKGKVNVVVITNPENTNMEYATLKSKVNSKLTEVTGKSGNVTLIRTKREHDRTVVTNYKRIYSGDSFSFWDKDGRRITNGREISYSTFGKKENHNLAIELIADIQATIEFLKVNNPDFIEGDKKSGYLTF